MAALEMLIDEELTTGPQTLHEALTSASTVICLLGDEDTHASHTNFIPTIFRFAGASDAIVVIT
jgi:hypothetical protein